jgi:hypothetical protein
MDLSLQLTVSPEGLVIADAMLLHQVPDHDSGRAGDASNAAAQVAGQKHKPTLDKIPGTACDCREPNVCTAVQQTNYCIDAMQTKQ